MMTLANYGLGSNRQKDPNSAKVLSKSLQIRNRAEMLLKQQLKTHYRISNDKRTEILNLISDYYSRIPFYLVIWNKYQTKQSIIDSILLLDTKFNPYKAREAFKLIEVMLTNLVHLPWHKEFRKICTYSGQFRLSISESLIGIEEVFKAAGFKNSAENPMHLILPDSRMPQVDDSESVTGVIFDCLMAQIICNNIIEVFENLCKSKQQIDENVININLYSWIQCYFRERSQHTTERACSNIQELLNNVSNHLSKLDFSAIKSTAQSNRVVNQSNDRDLAGLASKSLGTNSSLDIRRSPKPSAQERTREFLAQKTRDEVDNLLTLPSDLLRIPTTSHHSAISLNQNSNDSINHLSMSEIDTPINNDREPLIPYRKPMQHQSQAQPPVSSSKRNSLYDNEFEGGASSHLTKSNGHGHLGLNRTHHFDEPYFSEFSSHPQLPSYTKYNSSPYRKYESRDIDNNKLTNGKTHWSCGSCTYNNQGSEICEICRNRRPSR